MKQYEKKEWKVTQNECVFLKAVLSHELVTLRICIRKNTSLHPVIYLHHKQMAYITTCNKKCKFGSWTLKLRWLLKNLGFLECEIEKVSSPSNRPQTFHSSKRPFLLFLCANGKGLLMRIALWFHSVLCTEVSPPFICSSFPLQDVENN